MGALLPCPSGQSPTHCCSPPLSPECGLSRQPVCLSSPHRAPPTLTLAFAPQFLLKGRQPQAGPGRWEGRPAGQCRGHSLLPKLLSGFTCDFCTHQTAVTLRHPKSSPLPERFKASVWGQCLWAVIHSLVCPPGTLGYQGQLGPQWLSGLVSCVPCPWCCLSAAFLPWVVCDWVSVACGPACPLHNGGSVHARLTHHWPQKASKGLGTCFGIRSGCAKALNIDPVALCLVFHP